MKRRWNIRQAAETLPRFEFIAQFVAHQTRRKADRKLVEGLQVVLTPKGWTYFHEYTKHLLMTPAPANILFDTIRRTPLNWLVQKAEDIREHLLT